MKQRTFTFIIIYFILKDRQTEKLQLKLKKTAYFKGNVTFKLQKHRYVYKHVDTCKELQKS